MYTLLAHHTSTHTPPESSILSHAGPSRNWFEGPTARFVRTMLEAPSGNSDAYSGHLGVLRQEDPTFERQRRYDFWFKHP